MNVEWTAYLAPFSVATWSSLLLMVLVVSLSMALSYWACSEVFVKNYWDSSPESFGDILLTVFGSLCSQGKIFFISYKD